jgi:hypothetical protein
MEYWEYGVDSREGEMIRTREREMIRTRERKMIRTREREMNRELCLNGKKSNSYTIELGKTTTAST